MYVLHATLHARNRPKELALQWSWEKQKWCTLRYFGIKAEKRFTLWKYRERLALPGGLYERHHTSRVSEDENELARGSEAGPVFQEETSCKRCEGVTVLCALRSLSVDR